MEQALYQASISTFEDLGFMFPTENEDETVITESESRRVRVDFNGTFSGRIVLEVEADLLPLVAANMLGDDGPLETAMMQDVLGELANVICGNVLPKIADKKEVFRLEPPAVIDSPLPDSKPKAAAHLSLDEGRANILLYLN